MVLTYKTGAAGAAAGAMAEYLRGSEDVPEMAARLASYLGDAYALNVAAGTAALPMLDMHPLIANLMEIDTTRSLTQEEMKNLLAGKTSTGLPIPGREIQASTKDKTRLAFCDFTFSAPKSLSIAIAFAPSEKEKIVLETAFMRANNDLMRHIEREVGGARQGRGGRLGVVPGHMAVVQYHHATARPTKRTADGEDTKLSRGKAEDMRPGDMQRHIHNIFLHATITDAGDVKAPDLRETKGQIHTWGAIGHAFLVTHLRQAGIRAEIDLRTGLSHLPDVPEPMVDLFSARTRLREAMARARASSEGKDFDSLSPQEQKRWRHSEAGRGRQHKEDLSEAAFWQKTADDAGYVHQTVINPENRQGLAPEAERARVAYEAAIGLMEPDWTRRAKLDAATIRARAAQGFIASGIDRADEIETVISALSTEGVRQDGETVRMNAGRENGERFASATTALHADREREAIGILQRAAADKSAGLSLEQIDAAAERVAAKRGYDFTSPHGSKQLDLSRSLAMGGRAVAAVGGSGVGKTTLLEPVIDAYHEAGWPSYGVTLAWRQTRGLVEAGVGRKRSRPIPDTSTLIDAGIAKDHAFAMTPFLKKIETGQIKPDARTIVFIDELSNVDTQQILALARAQEKHGFKIAAVGDEAQCGAINAGNSIRLFRLGLGEDQIPELLDSIRQRRTEDRETAKMLRAGSPEQAGQALARKDAAGLLALVPGDYQDAIKAGVDWLEKRQADNAGREKYSVGVSVPSNADVHAFGLEYRSRQRAAGKLGDDWVIDACDQNGVQYEMSVAVGDRVRLFDRVNASFVQGKHGNFGDNGTVAEVVSVDPRYGLRLKRADGVVGAIRWTSIQDKDTGRVRLSYGTATTIDARQSETLIGHLTLLADGSHTVDRNKIYSADTRGRDDNVLIVSHGAEKEAVRNRRPLGDPWLEQATGPEMRQAVMDNMARNLSRIPDKGLAVEFLGRGLDINYGGINTQQAAWFKPPPESPRQQSPHPGHAASAVETLQTTISHSPIKLLTGPEEEQQKERPAQRAAARPARRARPAREPSQIEARTEFADALRQSGMRLKSDEPIMDGKWHRVAVDGDRGHKKSGRYRGYLDGLPAGFIENFKTGQAEPWRSKQAVPVMTTADHQRREAARMARESERHAAENKAALRAWGLWEKAGPVEAHAYLSRKGVASHGLRQTADGKLIVPMTDADGVVRNAQTITPDGEKRFLTGGRKQGLYAQLGAIEPNKPLLIAEGYATAATLREATGLPVIVAFDAGNLKPVAEAIRASHPDVRMVFAADNDWHLPGREIPLPNVGKEKAEAAAKAVDGIVILPEFGDQVLVQGRVPPTDWNDLAALHGRKAIEAQFKTQEITMPENKKTETQHTPTITQAMRDAAHHASRSMPQDQAARSQQQHPIQAQEQLRHSQRHGLER